MNTNNSNPVPLSDPAWQTLGELILMRGEHHDQAISRWLPEILFPLQLTEEFLNRVIRSAQETAARAVNSQAENAAGDFLLKFYIPLTLTAAGTSWGYFSVVKIEHPDTNPETAASRINFYLYLEGD